MLCSSFYPPQSGACDVSDGGTVVSLCHVVTVSSGDTRLPCMNTLPPCEQVLHDFNNGGVALRRHCPALAIGRLIDTQLALEVLLGDVQADLDPFLKVYAADHGSAGDGPHRCYLIIIAFEYRRSRCLYQNGHLQPYHCSS